MLRRSHLSIGKIRATSFTTADAPKNIASATAVPPSVSDAAARIRRPPHSGSLRPPAAEPGVLHVDLKELCVSHGGFRYVVFAIDEHTRYVFIDFIKTKDKAAEAVARIIAAFNATVGAGVDDDGRALPRPRVHTIHSDHEGKLVSE